MITGFNTDIAHEGVTYHVQTEDKGFDTPLILSLVYDRGTILASKRTPYNDLLEEKFDEKKLSERLQRQHKLICAAIKAGRIEELKRMTVKEAAVSKVSKSVISEDSQPITMPSDVEIAESDSLNVEKTGFETFIVPRKSAQGDVNPFETKIFAARENFESGGEFASRTEEIKEDEIEPKRDDENSSGDAVQDNPQIPVEPYALTVLREKAVLNDRSEEVFSEIPDPFQRETGKIPKPTDGLIFEVPKIISEPTLEKVLVVEEDAILPAEAVKIVAEIINQESVEDDKLRISFLSDMTFRGGDHKTLEISIHRGAEESGLANVHVIVKILGSTFKPMIFHARTEDDGIAVIQLQLPNFKAGRAVLLVRALHEGEETEIRRVIAQG